MNNMKGKKSAFRKAPAVRWHRPKARNTDIIIIKDVQSYAAQIPAVKGGGRLVLYHNSPGDFELYVGKNGRYLSLSLGELEALALLYAKVQELK